MKSVLGLWCWNRQNRWAPRLNSLRSLSPTIPPPRVDLLGVVMSEDTTMEAETDDEGRTTRRSSEIWDRRRVGVIKGRRLVKEKERRGSGSASKHVILEEIWKAFSPASTLRACSAA